MTIPLLEARTVTKRFGGLIAVNSVNLKIEPGRIHGVIGPNGAGKTTLFNVFAGVYRPEEGKVTLEGTDITGRPSHEIARLGVMRTFQNLQLFADMSVIYNIITGLHTRTSNGFFAALLGTPALRREEEQARDQARQAMSFVGLKVDENMPAAGLPYGHRRLLEIARAIVSKPKLLMLDEPAAGMNPQEAQQLASLIRRIRDTGVTVLVIEHHMDLVMAACEQITVLDHGQKIAEGSPVQIQKNSDVIRAYLGKAEV